MKGCRHAQRRILRAVDQELELEERFRLDEHLAGCRACRCMHARALRLEEALVGLPEPPRDAVDVERAVAAIRATLDERVDVARNEQEVVRVGAAASSRRRWLSWASAALGAAALVLVLLRDPRAGEPDAARSEVAVRSETAEAVAPPLIAEVTAAALGEALGPPASKADSREDVARELRAWIVEVLGARAGEADLHVTDSSFEALDRRLGRWPLERMAEDLLNDADPIAARGAARYLGLRGDRVSVSRLRAAAARVEVADAALRALGDMGQVAVGALAALLEDDELGGRALSELGRAAERGGVGMDQAAVAIEASLLRHLESRRGARAEERAPAIVDAHWRILAALGPPAARSLLRIAASAESERPEALEWLSRVEGGDVELARVIAAGSGLPTGLLLEAAERLQPASALPWVAERAAEHRHRARALRCLERWEGTTPISTLLQLDAVGHVPQDDVVRTFRRLADGGEARLARLADELVERRDVLELGRYLELLVASEHPAAADGVLVIALSDVLAAAERQWAALALGELGSQWHAHALVQALASLRSGDRRLFAAYLISIHRLLGDTGLRDALTEFPDRSQRLVFAALPDVHSASRSAPAARDAGAVALFRVARALGDTPRFRSPNLND